MPGRGSSRAPLLPRRTAPPILCSSDACGSVPLDLVGYEATLRRFMLQYGTRRLYSQLLHQFAEPDVFACPAVTLRVLSTPGTVVATALLNSLVEPVLRLDLRWSEGGWSAVLFQGSRSSKSTTREFATVRVARTPGQPSVLIFHQNVHYSIGVIVAAPLSHRIVSPVHYYSALYRILGASSGESPAPGCREPRTRIYPCRCCVPSWAVTRA